jgi:hypothetical protein
VQVTADSQTVEAGYPLDLGYRAVGAEIKLHVGAYDEDVHVCQIPMAPVRNFIQDTETTVEIYIKSADGQPDRRIKTTPHPFVLTASVPTEEPHDRTRDGTWKIPVTADIVDGPSGISLIGKRLVFKFAGTMDDVACSAPKHANSDEEAVDFAYRNYTAEATVAGLQLVVRPMRAPSGYAGIGIGAGGIDTPAHKAVVHAKVFGATRATVNFSLQGGEGAGTKYNVPFVGEVEFGAGQRRAILRCGSRTFEAGVTPQPISRQTDPDGIAKAILISSNKLEQCRILASTTLPGQGNVTAYQDVPFEAGDVDIRFDPDYLPQQGEFNIDVTLSHHGQPMKDHQLVVWASKVVAEGETFVFDQDHPQNLEQYILLRTGNGWDFWDRDPRLDPTNAQGKTRAVAKTVSSKQLDLVTIAVQDLSLRK